MEIVRRLSNIFLPYLFIGILGFILLQPLLLNGFYPVHDDTQVTRVDQMTKALSDGMFPVRWVPDLGYGYGYPIFNFYAPLAYYVGSAFMLIGFSSLTATKIMIAIPLFVAGLGMYLLSRLFWGRLGGLISTFMVMSAPYVAVNVFVRGAISEYYAYAFIPFVFYALFQIYQTGKFRFVMLGGVSLAAVVLSHNLTAMMLSPFLVISLLILGFLLVKHRKKGTGLLLAFSLLVAFLLSGFYWLPAIAEMDYTNVRSQVGGGADFRDHFVCVSQLWESQWGYGGSAPGCLDGMSYRVGKLHIVLGLISLPLLFLVKDKRKKIALLTGLVFAFVSTLLLLPFSQFLWELLSPFEFIQYPWRFLSILAISISFVSGACALYASFVPSKLKLAFALLLVSFTIFFGSVLYTKLFEPQTILPVTSKDYTREDIVRYRISAISDEYLPSSILIPESEEESLTNKVLIVQGEGTFEFLEQKTQELIIRVQAESSLRLLIRTAYFPSWNAYLNTEQVPITSEPTGIGVQVPQGNYLLHIVFEPTIVQRIGNSFSVIGIILLILGIMQALRKNTF